MSESEVSQIRDEDVLRRMWQQTEDFGRKKEIRAHMYKLREERLRDLYSPEPHHQGKGCEFSTAHAQRHGQSFADQSFQSMKSKEVRDASSPSKEFTYRGQDLKELSNAGWNVESEDRTMDDGRTHVKVVNANIEGRYDVEGGQGQFSAVDKQRRAVTEHQDANSSLRRDETSSNTAAHEHLVRQTDDGTRISSTTSSSNTSSKFQQVSSTTHEVPFEGYDRRTNDTNRNERVTRITNNDNEQSLRTNDSSTLKNNSAELVSRKVEYPDDNTRVIVETRMMPDGTRVTSTRREFRAPAQTSRSEYHSNQNKSYSSHHTSDSRDSSNTRHTTESRTNDIVDSQRHVDDYDFKRQLREYTNNEDDDHSTQHHVTRSNKKVTDQSQSNNEYSQRRYESRIDSKVTDQHQSTINRTDQSRQQRIIDIDQSTANRDDHTKTEHHVVDRRTEYQTDDTNRATSKRDHDTQHKIVKETQHVNDSEERICNVSRVRKDHEEIIQNTSRDWTVIVDGDREIPSDRATRVDRPHGVPKNIVPTEGETRDIPRDRTIPVDKTYDVPRYEAVPERFRDSPRDETIPDEKVYDIPITQTITSEKKYHTKKDTKVEEVIEKKTSSDHYQTTYQNDFPSRKVSTDWSPTHQAWASTLRSDTPSTTRPSTRASSPGSRTFKSSTSSLRSSVSPEKSHKKLSSRGGSPNKVDRYSPTRTVTSDRFSSIHSTHSVTEEKINKNVSPERKPPTGRSPTRHDYSPDRKPQDSYRQRPSVSPEKIPVKSLDRPNSSPELKSTDGHPRTTSPLGKKEGPKSPMEPRKSPERRPASQPTDENLSDTYPRTSPCRTTLSPDRKTFDHPDRSLPKTSPSPDRRPGYQKPATGYPRNSSPSQTGTAIDGSPRKSVSSPDKKSDFQHPSTQPKQQSDEPGNKYTQGSPTKRPSMSPERKPGYVRPTASSQPDEQTRKPKPEYEPDRKSPGKQVPKLISDQKFDDFNKITKIKEDHYRFVDEETKVYTDRTDTDNKMIKTSTGDDSCPRKKSPSPVTRVPDKDSHDYCKVPKSHEIPYDGEKPTRDSVTFMENDDIHKRVDKTVETVKVTTKNDIQADKNTTRHITKNKERPEENFSPNRETSPSKYGTYDKKKPRSEVDTTVVTKMTSEDTKELKFDSLTRRDKTSPKKIPGIPTSPVKKSPRDSTSPTKDTQYKHTTDFITTEKTTEEVNKKTTAKDRSRQLVTPSSSPTRKPKITETEPSTGQSSPTTSVSGFVYFGSPPTERPIVTDLDEFFPVSETPEETSKRPESLEVKRSPSPSKIPCRSPSPEKHIVPTTKESLPRKSSLKKPTTEFNLTSPVEKPPTNFRVSPTDDKPDILDHKVVKKDRSYEPETGEPAFSEKTKPPLQRRETYDDRCKKILGLVEDTMTDIITKETKKYTRKPHSDQNSPSVSPCDSPGPNESSPFSDYSATKKTAEVDVSDFIAHEREDLIKTTITCDQQKTKIPPRDNSPTKLQDIINESTLVTNEITKDKIEENRETVTTKYVSPRQSQEKFISPDSYQKRSDQNPDRKRVPSPSKPSDQSPDRKRVPSPSNLSNQSSDRKRVPSPSKPSDQSPDRKRVPSHSKPSDQSPDRKRVPSPSNLSDQSSDRKHVPSPSKLSDQSPDRKRVSSPSKPSDQSPDRKRVPSPSKPSDQSPDRKRVPSPSKPSDQSPDRKRVPSQSKPSDQSPDRKRVSSPSKPSDQSPDRKRVPLQTKPSDQSSDRKRVPSQSKPSDRSPDRKRVPSPSKPSDHSPDRKRVLSPSKPSDQSPDRKHVPSDQSPERKRVSSPSKPYKPTENLPAKSNLSPERKPNDKHLKDTSPTEKSPDKSPGFKKSITTIVTKTDVSSSLSDVKENIKITKTSKPTRVLESPTRESTRPSKILPEQTGHPRNITSSEQELKEGSQPKESSEKIPGYMKTTTSIVSKYEGHEGHRTTKDVNETHVKKVLEKKEPKMPSPTRQTIRAESPVKLTGDWRESDSKRPNTSPQRKPTQVVTEKQPDTIEEIPGYMRSTKTTVSKFDKTSISEDIRETIKSSTVEKQHSSSGSVLPTRKTSQPKLPSERTPSPTKPNRPSEISVNKRPDKPQLTSPVTESKRPTESSPTRPSPKKFPGYMKTTASITLKHEHDTSEYDITNTEEETVTSIVTENKYPRDSESPSRLTPKSTDRSSPEYLRTTSQSRSSNDDRINRCISPEPKLGYTTKNGAMTKPVYSKDTTTDITSANEYIEKNTNKVLHIQQKHSSKAPYETSAGNRLRTLSPSKLIDNLPRTVSKSPEHKPTSKMHVTDNSIPEDQYPKHTPGRSSTSPERPSYMKPTASITSKFDTAVTHNIEENYLTNMNEPEVPSSRKSPTYVPHGSSEIPGHSSKPEETRQLQAPSPTKNTTTAIKANTEFIMSEREQEILNKVQKSLRKLSPERKEKSPSRERSPTKTTTSLQDLEIITTETTETNRSIIENDTKIAEESTITSKVPHATQLKDDKSNDQKVFNKLTSRNVPPNKKIPTAPTSNKVDKTPDSPTKSRSFSPKKPISQVDRPQSPQQPKVSGIKPREHIPPHLTRKPTPATLSTIKTDKITTDAKKTSSVTKQNVSTKISSLKTTIKPHAGKVDEPEFKRTSTPKKDTVSTKKDVVTRTASDTSMKPKKTSSPQRMKSKPEIQVSDMSTKSPRTQKPSMKEPHSKLPTKPKSATSLNTSIDEDDIIIDVQQSKSSRENSPDRICPTPINFVDDVGVPRFPDEVSEPDDDIIKRTHLTIHETESVVDDIVEICEDEELFAKKSETEFVKERYDSHLRSTDNVRKSTNKLHSVHKPKDTTTIFKDTEKKVHSDFVDENLKSDECLLTVSEKVNKFAKGPRDTKDSRSPSRKITDEYDKDTVYTDDYSKLSVNDKAHLFVETAESIKINKVKPAQKVERPDLSQVDESLKSDDCLLSVSDKVNKFVKTAEQYITETQEHEEREIKIKQQHDKLMKQYLEDVDDEEDTYKTKETIYAQEAQTTSGKSTNHPENTTKVHANKPKQSQPKVKDNSNYNTKPVDRAPAVKITTLRSSEAVKKAKALFENIASTQKTNQKETTLTTKTTKLTDIGVIKKSPKSDSTTVLHPSVENISPQVTDIDSETDSVSQIDHPSSEVFTKPHRPHVSEKLHSNPNHLTTQVPKVPKSKSPMPQSVEITTTKTVLSRYPAEHHPDSQAPRTESPRQRTESPRQHIESPRQRTESPRQRIESPRQRIESPRQRTESPRQRPDSDKADKVPGYLRPTKTSQIKEETKIEETEVSSRRGSGKFGVELRRTSVERSAISSERRRSVEHHQPCIEDIFDLDLLEQMLEKVVGYEQRRRIRAQIRVAKNQNEQMINTNTYTKITKQTTSVPKSKSPEPKVTKSPERAPKTTPQRISSPERANKTTANKIVSEVTQSKEPITNGHTKEPTRTTTAPRQRPQSPEKLGTKSTLTPKTPVRQASPDKRRTTSPTKVSPKPKNNRFDEYASAYMKKVGLNETDKIKFTDSKTKKITDTKQTIKHEKQQETIQEFITTKNITERKSSKDVIELVQTNGKRSPSPEQRLSPEWKVQFPHQKTQIPDRKVQSPERRVYSPERKPLSPERKTQSLDRKTYSPERNQSPERLQQRTPSPDFKRPKSETVKETIIKTVYDIEKKIPSKPIQEEKPSWVTNRNLKKITSETRTFSSKKIENEKPKYRAPSPSKIIAKPIDVITSSYGPGPLDADGKPLFGIKALRNGGSNFQVKGTVIRQEFHSRNGSAPEGTVSVTAYSSQPEELEQLLAAQGAEPPSRIHGLAAITTTKKFGGDTGNTLANVHTKEDRASLEQFTHQDRRVEHLERSYDTTTQEFSGDTSIEGFSERTEIEDVTENRRTDSKKERQDRTDKSRKEEVTEIRRQENQRDRPERRTEGINEVKRQKVEERREKMERREDKKTVRQSSVKSLTEKFIKSANDSGKSDRRAYPKAGLILRTTTMRDSGSSDEAPPAGLTRADSDHSVCSVDDTVVTTTTERTGDGIRTTTTKTTHHHHHPAVVHTHDATITHHEPVITTKKTVITQEPVITTRKTMVVTQEPVVTTKRMTIVSQEPVTHRVTQGRQGATVTTERSFLDSSTKVTGVQDILTRMKNADIVIQEGDTTEDSEARALLNKFLGASVLMAGMQGYVAEQPEGRVTVHQETVRSSGGETTDRTVHELDLDQCWDERLLKKLLEECTDYDQRRRLRARIRTLMAEQEACASAVTEALGACGAAEAEGGEGEAREEEEITVTSSVRRDSSDKTFSSSTTTKTSKVIEMTRPAPKPVSPFAKFRQLEKQNSTNSPNSPKTPQSPGSPSQPYFKFTDPALQASALTIKERLLQWCRDKTRDYENVKLENFSTSWADGLAFCALIHHFLPTAFDYSKLTADRRRHNFTLAFKVADEKAGIYPLLDVDDMVAMRKPDWKCVFTYVQAIYRRFKDEP